MSSTTESLNRWALVSSLYGPGTFWSWLIIVVSVFISWTINPVTKRLDSITNDTIAALTLPVVAAVYALYQLAKYDRPDRPRLLLSHSPEDIQLVAALEAPLAICEVYVVLAIFLHSSASRRYQWKRLGCVTVSTFLCFSPQLVIFFTYPDLPVSRSTFARPFLFNFVLELGFIAGIMAIMTGVSIIRTVVVTVYRRAKPCSTEHQERPRARHSGFEKWSNIFAAVLIASIISIVKYGFVGNTTAFAAGLLGYQTRMIRFMPKSNVSLTDLDQMVAMAGGAFTLLFTSNPMVVRLFVLERGGISLDIETIDVMSMENRGLEYRKINPRGEVPALVLDNGFLLTEVTAICEYLDEIAQGGMSLFGETPLERAETRMRLRRMDLEIAQPAISWVRNDPGTAEFYTGHRIPIPEARLAQKVTIQQYLNLLDEQLQGKKYLCGRYSFLQSDEGKDQRYFERMDARKAGKKALEVFGARVEAQQPSAMT
ncbi:glutathione S-transferase GST [Fusarium sp. NRRL 52700]|nr:glutathione S-transferase GST [Fusarium sp. NRRL 52700]